MGSTKLQGICEQPKNQKGKCFPQTKTWNQFNQLHSSSAGRAHSHQAVNGQPDIWVPNIESMFHLLPTCSVKYLEAINALCCGLNLIACFYF